ncbi:hypothetical protein [Novosphingobium sp. PhB165]|uniref:hypothetical protein n=1 Tax=Novosphingobium sp. PhB165 TaxID=2485105 RepID=UPI001404C2E1|nr:hypothetical protein [Novosphingobium sp. PhB165]
MVEEFVAAKSSTAPAQTITPALERAARALCYVNEEYPDVRMGANPTWMHHLPEVRAVLEAVRDPSGTMSNAGTNRLISGCGRSIDEQDLEDAWRAMIDVALAGE